MANLISPASVPIVDISAWLDFATNDSDTKEKSAAVWHEAMTNFGCVIVVGHGIDEDNFSALNAESQSFFHKDVNEKLRYNHGAYGHPLGGYSPPGKEIVALSTGDVSSCVETKPKFDPVETLVFTSHPNNFVSPSQDRCPLASAPVYYDRMEGVLKAIHSLSCAALGLQDIHYFEQFYDINAPGNDVKGSTGNALKVAHYPPLNARALQAEHEEAVKSEFNTSIRYGAHTDYQGFTILRPDKNDWHYVTVPLDQDDATTVNALAGGLEVFHRGTQQWMQVKIPKHLNALVINAGDFIQRWTNDIWHSPLHRVVTATIAQHITVPDANATDANETSPTLADAQNESSGDAGCFARQSIVFFSGPLEHCLIECIDPVLMKPEVVGDMRVRKYAPIRSGDHLLIKLNRTNSSTV